MYKRDDDHGLFARSLLAGIVLFLTGCDLGESESGRSINTSGSAADVIAELPLSAYLGSDVTQVSQAAYMATAKQVEQRVAECMTVQGFRYTPFVQESMPQIDAPTMDYSSREYAETYGFGISLVDPTVEMSVISPTIDPNAELVGQMTDASRDAYYQALYGQRLLVTADPTKDADLPSGSDEVGCKASGARAVLGVPTHSGLDTQEPFQELMENLQSLYTSIQEDPRMGDAVEAWRRCLIEADYPAFKQVGDVSIDVSDRWSELNSRIHSGGSSENKDLTTLAIASAEEISSFQSGEIELAVTSWDCKQSTGYFVVSSAIEVEAERGFVTDHLAELEEYRDFLNSGG